MMTLLLLLESDFCITIEPFWESYRTLIDHMLWWWWLFVTFTIFSICSAFAANTQACSYLPAPDFKHSTCSVKLKFDFSISRLVLVKDKVLSLYNYLLFPFFSSSSFFSLQQQLQFCVAGTQTWLNCKGSTGKGIAAFLLTVSSYLLLEISPRSPQTFALQELPLPEEYVRSNTKETSCHGLCLQQSSDLNSKREAKTVHWFIESYDHAVVGKKVFGHP